MFRIATTAALALALSAPLAFAGESGSKTKDETAQQTRSKAPTPEELREIGAKRIQAQKDAISSYEVSDDARPDDTSLVEKLASPRTAEILLRKNVNNSQADEVAQEVGATVSEEDGEKAD